MMRSAVTCVVLAVSLIAAQAQPPSPLHQVQIQVCISQTNEQGIFYIKYLTLG